MYLVELTNGRTTTQIYNEKTKLTSGKVVKGINGIDSFTFTINPYNAGWDLLHSFTSFVTVFNTNKNEYEFMGRVLYTDNSMDESGALSKEVTCESYFGFLCDSVQTYVEEQNWTVRGLLQHILDIHNSQTEPYKHFFIGELTVSDPNDNLYCGIQRENTWDTISKKLIEVLGGEIRFREVDGVLYLDYLTEIGESKTTEIALSRNMKSIKQEKDPSAYITRLIPLGCKLTKEVATEDEEGNVTVETVQTEERLNIAGVNNGLIHIDDEAAIEQYGIHVGVVEWDDVTTATALYNKGVAWMKENNRVAVKYSITALDLSLLGLDIDSFEVGNKHPVKNGLLAIDDTVRIIKKSIDVCEEVKSTIEVGDNLKTLSDIQREQATEFKAAAQNIESLKGSEASTQLQLANLNKRVSDNEEKFTSEIQQLSDSIKLEVSGSLGSKANIILSVGANKYTGEMELSEVRKAFAGDATAISISAGTITFNAGTLIINSENFTLTKDGTITANAGKVGGWTLKNYKLYAGDGETIKTVCVQAPTENNLYVFAAGGASHDSYADCPFRVTKAGKLYATDAIIHGDLITIDGSFKTEMDKGSLRLYYSNVLCGTINTKYWSGAATEGISLRVEEGGHYIMFSHADDTQGSGYTVDYYLNAGWSSNYDEMHIFQTSARFLDDVYFAGYTRIRSLRLFGSGGEYLVGIDSNGELTVSKL